MKKKFFGISITVVLTSGVLFPFQDFAQVFKRPLIATSVGITFLASPMVGCALLYPASLCWGSDNITALRQETVNAMQTGFQEAGNSLLVRFFAPDTSRQLRNVPRERIEQGAEIAISQGYQQYYRGRGWRSEDAEFLANLRQRVHDKMGINSKTLGNLQQFFLPVSVSAVVIGLVQHSLKNNSAIAVSNT